MRRSSGEKVLFIDIDGTVTKRRPKTMVPGTVCGASLLWLMCRLADDTGSLPFAEARKRVEQIHAELRWWHWTDYIRALNLDAQAFWQYAFEQERRYLQPVEPTVVPAIHQLHRAGYTMLITSNNPCSGILHKLRIAGLAENWGSPYFVRYLGAADIHCMKSKPEYWRRCLAHTGLAPAQITVIGDEWHADVLCPREAGITHCVHLDLEHTATEPLLPGVARVHNWAALARLLVHRDTPGPTSPATNISLSTYPGDQQRTAAGDEQPVARPVASQKSGPSG